MQLIDLKCEKCGAEIEYHKLPITWLVEKESQYTLWCPFCDCYLGKIRPIELEEKENEINDLIYRSKRSKK